MKHLVVPSGTVLTGEAETTQVNEDYKQDVWKYPNPAFVGGKGLFSSQLSLSLVLS